MFNYILIQNGLIVDFGLSVSGTIITNLSAIKTSYLRDRLIVSCVLVQIKLGTECAYFAVNQSPSWFQTMLPRTYALTQSKLNFNTCICFRSIGDTSQ